MKRRHAGLPIAFTLTSCFSAFGKSDQPQQEKPTVPFYFVQITDMHIGKNDNLERSTKVINEVNALPLDIKFVAETGDLFSHDRMDKGTNLKDTLSLIRELKAPVHHVPGNHDLPVNRHEELTKIYTQNFGKLIESHEYNGVVNIFVYTEPLAKNFSVPGYEPLKELEKELIAAAGKPVMIFHHTPSADDYYANTMHKKWNPSNREKWVNLLNAYNVKAVFAGHFHRDELHWLGNVPLYVSSSVGDTMHRDRQTTYRIYEYNNGKISYRTQYLK